MNSEVTGVPAGAAPEVSGEQVLELVITGVAHGGWCVARDRRGRVVFVRHALPGERVRARVTGATAKFARADAIEVLEPSPDRVTPPCPHARPGGCGGCDWQHASLAAQRRLKADVVRHQLARIAGQDRDVTVEPLPGDNGGLDWRTRVRFSIGPAGVAGLLAHRSHEVIPVGDCPIAHPLVRGSGVTGQRWDRVDAVDVATSPGSGERTVIIIPAPGRRPRAGEGEPGPGARAVTALADRVGCVLTAGRGGRLTGVRGAGSLRQHAAGRTWRVSAGVFWQVHPGAAEVLAEAVLAALEPEPGDAVLDLYCGAGLFAGVLAPVVGSAGSVIAVESHPAAVRDARHNLRRTPWARVRRGEVAAVLGQPGTRGAGLAVLDPPRTGAGRQVIERLLTPADTGGRVALRRVAYVSCDPATLARDIAIFAESRWRLAALRAFDAFPMTHHVECLATLVPG